VTAARCSPLARMPCGSTRVLLVCLRRRRRAHVHSRAHTAHAIDARRRRCALTLAVDAAGQHPNAISGGFAALVQSRCVCGGPSNDLVASAHDAAAALRGPLGALIPWVSELILGRVLLQRLQVAGARRRNQRPRPDGRRLAPAYRASIAPACLSERAKRTRSRRGRVGSGVGGQPLPLVGAEGLRHAGVGTGHASCERAPRSADRR
jgi:hypothetical protein